MTLLTRRSLPRGPRRVENYRDRWSVYFRTLEKEVGGPAGIDAASEREAFDAPLSTV